MITGHLLDLPAANTVRPAVADVTDEHLLLSRTKQGADNGCAHAVKLARTRASFDNLPIRDADAGEQAVLFLAHSRVEVKRPGKVVGGGGAKEVDDGVGREATRYVARAMAAHPVRNDEQLVLL